MSTKLRNILTIFTIFVFGLLLLPNFVQAINVNMNLSNTTSIDTSLVSGNSISTENPDYDNDNAYTPSYISTGSTVSTLNSLPEAELGLTNILSIILIVIGILLILLAIAIIIRLKN